MGKVTIVANGFSEETRNRFQEEANALMEQYNYGPCHIRSYLANKHRIGISMHYKGEETILNCHSFH